MARQLSHALPMVAHRPDSGIILCQNVKVCDKIDTCSFVILFQCNILCVLFCQHELNRQVVFVELMRMANSYLYVNFFPAITCPSLPVPTNGVKTGCTDIVSEPYDTHCSFSCNIGFNLIGSSTSRCLENQTWSAEAPICQG